MLRKKGYSGAGVLTRGATGLGAGGLALGYGAGGKSVEKP